MPLVTSFNHYSILNINVISYHIDVHSLSNNIIGNDGAYEISGGILRNTMLTSLE